MDKVILRPGRSEDARPAARLIFSTGPLSFNVAFGSEDRALSILWRLFTRPWTIVSYLYCTVAELHGNVAGILILYDHSIAQRIQFPTALELLRHAGPLVILFRLPVFLRQNSSNPNPKTHEMFVANVAVDPRFQGNGIGKLLMKHAESAACARSCSRISLSVRRDNASAIGLYRSLGYIVRHDHTDPWLKIRYGHPGTLHMTKNTL